MSHISSIGAGMYSDLSVSALSPALTAAQFAALDTYAEFKAKFAAEIASVGGVKATDTFVRVKNVREFPALGTPPNVVNVPVYGQATSQQIQGQSDAPSMEITINYIPSEWAAGTLLGDMVGDGLQHIFRFSLMNANVTGSGNTAYASLPAGLGTTQNSQYFWVGKIDALQVNPQLTDANTATITITMQSEFFGAYTEDAA
jgi:hypothetical protein